MNEKKTLKWLIGLFCIFLLILAGVIAVFLDSRSPNPILGFLQTETETDASTEENNDPTQDEQSPSQGEQTPSQGEQTPSQGEQTPSQGTQTPSQGNNNTSTEKDNQVSPPEELPPSVIIPPEKDPDTGETIGISFPCEVPGYHLTIEKMAPYSGIFVEDGTNSNTQNVAMLLVYNNGNVPIEYTRISIMYGETELLFDLSALPAGEKIVVQEKTGKSLLEGQAISANALVVQRANMEMSEKEVRVTDNGDNTITIKNLTDKTIPTVRVFYKYYMEDEEIFVGGIAFTTRITRLGAGASITVQPSHYTSQTSRVVMVLTYDSEV